MSGDFDLAVEELREVTRVVAETARGLLAVFEDANPGDSRPRVAVAAADEFVGGARRTARQRVASLDAHRAAREAVTEASRLAAQAAGDAASAAYLHPIAKAHQVGHILRAAANAARIVEIGADGDRHAATQSLRVSQSRATPVVIDVLRRYPTVTPGRSRTSQLMSELDVALRR